MEVSEIRNNVAANRYELDVNGVTAIIDYSIVGDTLTITHSEVPVALRGFGVGKVLVEKTMNAIQGEGRYKVVPVCGYVRSVVEKNGMWSTILK